MESRLYKLDWKALLMLFTHFDVC